MIIALKGAVYLLIYLLRETLSSCTLIFTRRLVPVLSSLPEHYHCFHTLPHCQYFTQHCSTNFILPHKQSLCCHGSTKVTMYFFFFWLLLYSPNLGPYKQAWTEKITSTLLLIWLANSQISCLTVYHFTFRLTFVKGNLLVYYLRHPQIIIIIIIKINE